MAKISLYIASIFSINTVYSISFTLDTQNLALAVI
nr:MAG TPA: hypothetical protein [Caudoviricetes sp.]